MKWKGRRKGDNFDIDMEKAKMCGGWQLGRKEK